MGGHAAYMLHRSPAQAAAPHQVREATCGDEDAREAALRELVVDEASEDGVLLHHEDAPRLAALVEADAAHCLRVSGDLEDGRVEGLRW